jgi:hypothetical protein
MTAKLPLTRIQRSLLFAGECPRISGTGKCPVEQGQVYPLSSKVSIKVLAVRVPKPDLWMLHYELRDTRDKIRLLKHTPSISQGDFQRVRNSFDPYGYPQDPTPDVLHEAAQESAYSSAPVSLVPSAGEAVDEQTQSWFTKEARIADNLRAEFRREQWELKTLSDRLRELERIQGVDLSRQMAAVRKTVQAMEMKARKRAA